MEKRKKIFLPRRAEGKNEREENKRPTIVLVFFQHDQGRKVTTLPLRLLS